MKLRVLATGSKGNCYLLENDEECLAIEAGLSFKKVQQAINFSVSKIKGLLVSHCHLDHSAHMNEFGIYGIPILAPYQEPMDTKTVSKFGNFGVRVFELVHDVPCFGFYIVHPEMGTLVYATDTEYIKWRFQNVNHFILGVDYDEQYVDATEVKFRHVVKDHMSISTACEFLKANNSRSLQSVIFAHLSDTASDPLQFMYRANQVVNCPVYVTKRGNEIELITANREGDRYEQSNVVRKTNS